MMGTPMGTSEKKTKVTMSPANMLANKRMVSGDTAGQVTDEFDGEP